MPVVPPYYLSKIWCLWPPLRVAVTGTQGCSLMIWCHKNTRLYIALWFDVTKTQNLMPVVPPYHLSKIWCLWSPLTIWAKFHACGPLLPFKQNLMPVVPPLPFGFTRTQGCSLMIWCHKNARLYIGLWFDVTKTQNLMPVVPPYHLSKIWCLWSPLTIWVKLDACRPPLLFEQNLMPVVPPYQ